MKREWLLGLGIIAFSNLAVRVLLYSFNYRGVSLFCGDSSYYLALAYGTPPAGTDRPSGFPYVLRLLLAVSESPEFLLAASTTLAVAAQLLCWRLLSPNFVSPLAGAILTSVLFLDPIAVKMTSMVFMADTLAVFLLCAGLALLLGSDPDPRRGVARVVLGLLVLGYLSIVKYSFLYPSAAAAVIVVAREARRLRSARVVAALVLAWWVIPAAYAVFVNRPVLGTYSLDNFGGRSMLATIVPGATCDQLRDAAGNAAERRALERHCRDRVLAKAHGSVLLWDKASVLNEALHELVGKDRVRGNRIFRRMAVRFAIAHPEQVVLAVARNLRDHVSWPETGQATMRQLVLLGAGCEIIARDFFDLEAEEYLRRWKRANGLWLDVVDWSSRLVTQLVNALSLGVLGVLLVARPRWFLRRSEPLLLLSMTIVYAASAMIGSPYDLRIAWVLDLLCVLTATVAYSCARRPLVYEERASP